MTTLSICNLSNLLLERWWLGGKGNIADMLKKLRQPQYGADLHHYLN
ncbi:hypothetical protein [Candidatus Leptofilum sp.]